MTLTEAQLQLIQNIASAFIGVAGSEGIRYFANKKTKEETEDEHADAIAKASSENVKAAQQVVDMLQEMLSDQRTYFDEQIKRAEDACNQKIFALNDIINSLKDDNESLRINVARLERENTTLNVQLVKVKTDHDALQVKYDELKKRFSKYENGIITGDHTDAVKKAKEASKK